MIFNKHSRLAGQHAYLSASKPHWISYDDEKFDRVMLYAMTAARGTELHDYAAKAIRLKIRQPDDGSTLSMYINDAIDYNMTPEQVFIYSEWAFGTADAASFRQNTFRCHDLKNGVNTSSFKQLMVYFAYFCLEYEYSPFEVENELRIYQNDEVRILVADPDEIFHIIDRVVYCTRRMNELREEVDL